MVFSLTRGFQHTPPPLSSADWLSCFKVCVIKLKMPGFTSYGCNVQEDNSSLLHPSVKEGNTPHPYRPEPSTEASDVLHDGRAHHWITDLIKRDILNFNGQKYKVIDQAALSYVWVTQVHLRWPEWKKA